MEHFRMLNIFQHFRFSFLFCRSRQKVKRPGDFLKAYRSARTVSTVITTLCQHFSLYQPTYPRRLFAPLWGFKYVDVEIAELALSFFLLPSSSHSESSETLFAVPSSRKLTVQPPAAFPTAPPFLPTRFSPYVLGCYGSSGRFLCSNNRTCEFNGCTELEGYSRDTSDNAMSDHSGIQGFRMLIASQFR